MYISLTEIMQWTSKLKTRGKYHVENPLKCIEMGKNPVNYKSIRKETNIYEQKPINIDDFNESEEAEVKQWVEKRKQKRQAVAEKNKLLKKKQKAEETKITEKDMWNRLATLNGEFKKIKKEKKESKKMSKTIMN